MQKTENVKFKIFYLGHAKSPAGKFFNWDYNTDGLISRDEVLTLFLSS